MGCNCKSDKSVNKTLINENKEKISITKKIINFALRTIVFLTFILFLPFIITYIIWMLFKTIFLNKDIDIKPLLMMIADKFKIDDEDEIYETGEDDYVLMDVEELTPIKHNVKYY